MPHSYKLTLIVYLALVVFCGCSKTEDNIDPNPVTNNIALDFVKTLGGSKNESAQSITKTLDGGYAILGYAQSMDGDVTTKTNESFDYWLLKFDQNHILQWQKTYGGSDDDRGSDIIQTTDGGFALIGFSQSNDGDLNENAGNDDFWVTKLNASGNIIWQKTFGFLGTDSGLSIIQTHDDGFLVTGILDVTASNGQGKNSSVLHAGGDYWAIKLDALGEKEWSKFYGGSLSDTPFDVIQTKDNGYIIIGSSDSNDVDITNNKGAYDFWIIKISETGTLLWEKSFGGKEIDEAHAITSTADGNYIIVGDTRSNDLDVSNNKGVADVWIIKISPMGELIWEKTFGGTSFDAGRSISKTQDDGFIISGNSRSANGDVSSNSGQNDAWILKIDNQGSLKWQKSFGGSNIDFAKNAIQLNDNSIIGVGESSSSNADIINNKGFSDLLIFKIK
ncbi:hypothetical protein [uncultured Algibacter sp.]|uniref:hypothetical protein n=1 Tax=uncultured Algibacter sp. TaxID=298659 RepID=UPI003216FD56